MSELLTTAEVAKRLRVSKYTVRRYVNAGLLPAARPMNGSPFRIPADAVDGLVKITVPTAEPEPEQFEGPLQFSPRSARSRAQQGRRRTAAA